MAGKQNTLEEKMTKKSREELVDHVKNAQMQERLLWAKSLIDIFGKEQAKRIIQRTVYHIWYDRGRQTAQAMGYPEDMHGFLEAFLKRNEQNPITPIAEIVEKNETRLVIKMNKCFIADAYERSKKNRADFETFGGEDVWEVAKVRCTMDEARWNGFNPRIKVTRTKFFMDGDGCCEWVLELGK